MRTDFFLLALRKQRHSAGIFAPGLIFNAIVNGETNRASFFRCQSSEASGSQIRGRCAILVTIPERRDAGISAASVGGRSEERRVGKECVSPCSSRWWPYP